MQTTAIRALFVHQGFELYGSDRSFIQSVAAFRERFPDSRITVLVPRAGPLYDALQGPLCNEVRIDPMLIPRGADGLKFFLTLPTHGPLAVWRAWKRLRQNDFLYINTVKVMDYMIAARFAGIPAMLHQREIFAGAFGRALDALAVFSRCRLVYNSYATARSFAFPQATPNVVYNGVPALPDIADLPACPPLNLLFLGRFNGWKGQELLVEALSLLQPQDRQRVRLRLVGDVFGDQHHYKTDLMERIARHGLQDQVRIEPFAHDIRPHLSWCHALLAPSTRPEPFGRVAAEAMAAGRPVLAANHGGLAEIVEDGVTGYLFTPDNAAAIAECIVSLLENPTQIERLGVAARQRHAAHFSEEAYKQRMAELYVAALQDFNLTVIPRIRAANSRGIQHEPHSTTGSP